MIPSREGATRLPETLRSVAAQEVPGRVQIVVVDDGSTDGTTEAAGATPLPWGPPQVVRHAAARGRAAACNAGIACAQASVVAVLDDDMTLRGGALAAHLRFHDANPGAAAVGRIVLGGTVRDSAFVRFLRREEGRREHALLARRHDLPFALCLTGHFSSDVRVLREAGGYDETITRYGFEDIELAHRLTRAGTRIAYLPEAEAVHRAYMTDLERYLVRHAESGVVARQLAGRHQDGDFRAYLRVDAPVRLGLGRDPLGLVGLRMANRLLLRRPARRLLGSRYGLHLVRAVLRGGETLGLDAPVHFGYHVLRDLFYFQGYFGDRMAGSSGLTG